MNNLSRRSFVSFALASTSLLAMPAISTGSARLRSLLAVVQVEQRLQDTLQKTRKRIDVTLISIKTLLPMFYSNLYLGVFETMIQLVIHTII